MDHHSRKRSAIPRARVESLEQRLFLDASIRIDAGGPAFKDSSGLTWSADTDFTGGTAIHTALAIASTTADALYYNYRSGNFSYSIPLANGSYSLRLLFTEPTMTAKNKRTFNVIAEGQTILSNFDLFAAGGTKTAISKTFTVNVADGQLNLNFQGVINNAVLSAIQTTLISAAPTATLPAPPVVSQPVVNSSSAITLGWASVSNATSYLIQRSQTGSDPWTAIGPAGGVTTTSFQDTNLNPATQYFYQVFSKNAAGTSTTASNIVFATTLTVAPAQPTVTVQPDNSVEVDWTAVDGATSYFVQRSLSGTAGSWTTVYTTLDGRTVSFLDQNTVADTTYYYQIIATDAGGNSVPSPIASTPVLPANAPGTLIASAVSGSKSISLSWGASSNATQYFIQRSAPDTGSGFNWQQIGSTTSLVYPDNTVDFDSTYAYQIIANNIGGPSLPGNTAVATTVPAAPDPLLATTASFVAINLSWADVPGETGFSVERNGVEIAEPLIGVLSISDSNLSPGTSYSYRVRAMSDAGFSPYSATQSASTGGTTKFLNVGGPVFVDSLGNHWDADTGSGWNGGNATTGTAAVANTVDDALFDSRRSGSLMTYTLPAQAGFYQLDLYFVDPTMSAVGKRVFNVSAQGLPILSNFDIVKTVGPNTADIESFPINIINGQLSLTFTGVTYFPIISAIHLKALAPPVAPNVPTGFAGVPLSSTSERLIWSEDASSSVSLFLIDRFDPIAGTFSQVGTVPGNARGFSDIGLSADTDYQYEIQAIGPGGNSDLSDPIVATTLFPLSSPWIDGDVGAVGLAGGAGMDGSAFVVSGSGADLFGTADAFHFVDQGVNGDVTIIAQITAEANTDPWARAGLVIRTSTAATSAMAGIFLTPGNGVAFQNRLTDSALAGGLVTFPAGVGVWLKLVRNVNTVSGYYSTDNVNWTLVGGQTFASVATVYVGLGVCAHNNGLLNSSTFDNVSVVVSTPFQWMNGANAPLTTFESPNAVVGDNLYVFGGFYNAALKATTLSNVYNLDSNSWSPIAPMPIPVTHAGVAVVGTDIYFAGGFVGDWPSTITGQFMMYDTVANTWTVLTPLPSPRGAGGMVLLGDQLHFYGGLNAKKTADMGDHWVFDLDHPELGWTTAAPMPGPRNHLGFVALNGLAYAIGGEHLLDEDHSNQTEVDAYDPSTDSWTTVAPLPVGRSHNHTSSFIYDGKIVIITGQENGSPKAQTVADAMVYDPQRDRWTMLASAAPAVREAAAAKVIGNFIVVTGGADQAHIPQSTTWVGDLSVLFPTHPVSPLESILPLQPEPESAEEGQVTTPPDAIAGLLDIAKPGRALADDNSLFESLPEIE